MKHQKDILNACTCHTAQITPADLEQTLLRATLFRVDGRAAIKGHFYTLPPYTPLELEDFFLNQFYARATLTSMAFPLSNQALFLPLDLTLVTLPLDPFDIILVEAAAALAAPDTFRDFWAALRAKNKKIALWNLTAALLDIVKPNALFADILCLTYDEKLTPAHPVLAAWIADKGIDTVWITHVKTAAAYKHAIQNFSWISGPFIESHLTRTRHKKCLFGATCSFRQCQKNAESGAGLLKCFTPAFLMQELEP